MSAGGEGNFKELSAKNAHSEGIWTVAWTRKTNTIITGSADESVKFWNPDNTSEPIVTLADNNNLATIGVSANAEGTRAASSSMDGILRIYDVALGKSIRTVNALPQEIWTISMHPTLSLMATGSHAGKVNVWDWSGDFTKEALPTEGKFTMSVCYSPCGKYLAAGSIDGTVTLFDVATKSPFKLTGQFAHVKAVRSLSFSADSKLLFSASDDGSINAYAVQTHEFIGSFAGHMSWVLSVACNPMGESGGVVQFASSGADKKVKIWDFNMRQCIHTFEGHTNQVWSLAYDEKGSRLASVGDDCFLRIWHV